MHRIGPYVILALSGPIETVIYINNCKQLESLLCINRTLAPPVSLLHRHVLHIHHSKSYSYDVYHLSTETQPDLASTVIDLAKDIESLMASLYDLQMALINVTRSGPRSLSTDIHEIRSPLKDDWEEIRALLQCCHAFGGRAIMLKDVIRMGTDDLVETLSYFSETAVELVERSAKVIERSQAFAEWLTERVPKLYGILQQLSSSSPPSPRPAYGMAQPAEPWQIALPASKPVNNLSVRVLIM